jgi:hypothetical protein
VRAARGVLGHALRRRSAFVITEAELTLIASATISGNGSQPAKGYSTPAPIGTPRPF